MTRNPWYVVKWGCVGGRLTCIINEIRKLTRNLKGLRRTYVCEGVVGVRGGVGSRK